MSLLYSLPVDGGLLLMMMVMVVVMKMLMNAYSSEYLFTHVELIGTLSAVLRQSPNILLQQLQYT